MNVLSYGFFNSSIGWVVDFRLKFEMRGMINNIDKEESDEDALVLKLGYPYPITIDSFYFQSMEFSYPRKKRFNV
jgi:hypothetical protein